VWQKLKKLAVMDKQSPLYGAKPADVVVENGRLQLKATPSKGEAFGEVMKRANMSDVEGSALGRYGSNYEAPSATANANMNKKEPPSIPCTPSAPTSARCTWTPNWERCA
jgi:xanthine dehydrogenase YagR molybdenum-binding subunit